MAEDLSHEYMGRFIASKSCQLYCFISNHLHAREAISARVFVHFAPAAKSQETICLLIDSFFIIYYYMAAVVYGLEVWPR